MTTLKAGDKAPNFSGLDQNGATHTLADYKGKKLVVFFYPKASTPGCTAEACDLRDNFALYDENELKIITDLIINKHYEYGLGIPILSPLHKIYHKIYGKGDNTPKQFEEFKQRYYNFEFDNLLDNKYKFINILLKGVG